MTTKLRIIGGFAVMVILIGIMAALGNRGLGVASSSFDEYRRLARLDVLSSEMVAEMNRATAGFFRFTSTDDVEHLSVAYGSLKKIGALTQEAGGYIALEERRRLISQVEKDAASLNTSVNSVEKSLGSVVTQYTKILVPSSHTMAARLAELHELALKVNNNDAAAVAVNSLNRLGTVRSAISRFSQSRTEADAARAQEVFAEFKKACDAIGTTVFSSDGRKVYAELQQAVAAMEKAFAEMLAQCESLRRDSAQVSKFSSDVEATLVSLSKAVDDEMHAQGTTTLESNSNAQAMMLGITVAGLTIAVILATLIILGLMRLLRELGVFATAIADGNFRYDVKITEKGEVGQMVGAMRHIPEELNRILDEYSKLEHQIETGNLTSEGNAQEFKGDFATLVGGTNAVLSRFRLVLENIPSPVVMLNADLKAVYLNTVARNIAGEDYKGRTCAQLLAREDFGSDKCALTRAVQSKRPASAETRAHPQGKEMDVSYTAIPMVNAQGQLLSVLQLITDLTATKETQRKIIRVAEQASGISNRVAAASEELSAQVEQVSRGAEMQRERVESTASAMNEMNSTVLEVARNSGQASEQTEQTRSMASQGADLVNHVVAAINSVNQVTSNMQTNMQELGAQAESIGGVMNVISDIADQTNLLALNAAIEAARAGEAGRGFAVVADEVRKLAEKTMQATNEVGSNISAIQHSARVNVEAVDKASKAVASATEQANSSGIALAKIVDLASASSAVVTSIATAAEEQSATSEEISLAINEITHVVSETAEGMIQASAAVQELSAMAQELNRVMGELK